MIVKNNVSFAFTRAIADAVEELRIIISKIIKLALSYFSSSYFLKYNGHILFKHDYGRTLQNLISEKILIHSKRFSEPFITACREYTRSVSRETYENFTCLLRQEILCNDHCLLRDFCKNLYESPLNASLKKLVELELKIKDLEAVERLIKPQFLAFLKKEHYKLEGDFLRAGSLNRSLYDPRKEGDLPSWVYCLDIDSRKIKVLRTPNVTLDVKACEKTQSEVVPEFRSYLSSGHRHLYINLMITQAPCGEQRRSFAIKALSSKFKNFTFISLDKDSQFYYQSHSFKNLSDAEAFKSTFLLFVKTKLNFDLPDDYPIEERLKPILDAVHLEFFKNSKSLERQQRREFIELSYCAMIEDFLRFYNSESVNISCKSTIDRGAAQLALSHAFHHRAQKNYNQSLITMLALGPALANQNRAMLQDRFFMMHQTLERLL